MRFGHFKALAFVLTLAACGEEQSAQNAPPTNRPDPIAPPAQNAPTAPLQSPAGQAQPPTASVPPATSAPGRPPAGGAQSSSATDLQTMFGRTFRGGPVALQLGADGAFTMREVEANRGVSGRYSYASGNLTFLDGQGETGGTRFPMRCRIERTSPEEFRLTAVDESCRPFENVTFRAGN